MCLSPQRPGVQRDFVWWEEVSGLSLPGDVCADFVFAIFFHCCTREKREGRERGGESDSCFYLGCRCNAFGPNAKCLGHTRFIQIDSALLSGNGLLKVNFRINTTATRLFPSASLGRRALFFSSPFLFPSEFSEGCVSSDLQLASILVFFNFLCVQTSV